jgi:hypothetical protein
MKTKCLITTFLLMIFAIHSSFSQEGNCKVLKPEIANSYSGDCKKGLANGKGIATGKDKYEGKFKNGLPNGDGLYQYATGEIYEGNFKDGLKNGNGKFTFKYLGKDSTYLGIWKDDQLVKKVIPPAYTIIQQLNVQRFTVQKINAGNRIMFSFIQNGKTNLSLSGLSFAENGGTPITIGQKQGFDNIPIPYNCKVTYTSLNSFRASSSSIVFEIQIHEPGQWLVTLYN